MKRNISINVSIVKSLKFIVRDLPSASPPSFCAASCKINQAFAVLFRQDIALSVLQLYSLGALYTKQLIVKQSINNKMQSKKKRKNVIQ